MKNHSRRVAALTSVLCKCLRLNPGIAHQFVLSAYFHDIGKGRVPESILNKPEALTPEEVKLVRTHTKAGEIILRGMGHKVPAIVALRHHEAWDGSGYPDGLVGGQIPFAARAVSVCDVYSALREERPYRKGMSHDEALRIMLAPAQSCKFDPGLLSAFADHHLLFKTTADRVSSGGDFDKRLA